MFELLRKFTAALARHKNVSRKDCVFKNISPTFLVTKSCLKKTSNEWPNESFLGATYKTLRATETNT